MSSDPGGQHHPRPLRHTRFAYLHPGTNAARTAGLVHAANTVWDVHPTRTHCSSPLTSPSFQSYPVSRNPGGQQYRVPSFASERRT